MLEETELSVTKMINAPRVNATASAAPDAEDPYGNDAYDF